MSAGAPDIGALLAQLGGGGGPGGPPPGPGAGPPPGGPGPPGQGGGDAGQALDLIKQIVDLCQQYLQAEPDQEDKLQGTKLLQLAQQLLAKDQQDRDQAMGGSNQRILRKAG